MLQRQKHALPYGFHVNPGETEIKIGGIRSSAGTAKRPWGDTAPAVEKKKPREPSLVYGIGVGLLLASLLWGLIALGVRWALS